MRQKLKGGTQFAGSNRVELEFLSQSRERKAVTMQFSGQWGSQTFSVPFVPVAVIVDPDEKLCDATTDHYERYISTGIRIYPEAMFDIDVVQVPDTAILRITHHWVAPDPLVTPVEGLTISNYRYWSLEGILPAGFRAKGWFTYTTSLNLDNGLIKHPQDSVVLLYREAAGHGWTILPAKREGTNMHGKMVVDSLMPGEYAIAVFDHVFLVTPEPLPGGRLMRAFPNPSFNTFSIQLSEQMDGILEINDAAGRQVDTILLDRSCTAITWKPHDAAPGVYILMLRNSKGNLIESTKLVYGNG
jgi:aminopeptidase N